MASITGKVLIVDDNPADLQSVSDLLIARGFETLTASGSSEAFHLVRTSNVCVAIVDKNLAPGDFDGNQAAGKITEISPACKIIMFTITPDPKDDREARSLGLYYYFPKSNIYTEAFIETVRNAMGGKPSPYLLSPPTTNLELEASHYEKDRPELAATVCADRARQLQGAHDWNQAAVWWERAYQNCIKAKGAIPTCRDYRDAATRCRKLGSGSV